MSTTDGYVGLFRTPDAGGAIIAKTSGTPAVAVTEEVEVQDNSIISHAKISITTIDIDEGAITGAIVLHSTDNTNWKTLPSVNFENALLVGTGRNVNIYARNMPYRTGSTFTNYFKIYFLNSDNELAIKSSDNTTLLMTGSQTFNGKDDLAEYPSVTNLLCSNALTNTEGDVYASPAKLPINGVARLEWDDMTRKGAITAHPFADGTPRDIREDHWKRVTGYIVFMYIAGSAAPEFEYPKANIGGSAVGVWYNVIEVTANRAEVTVPLNKKVAFYVCAKLILNGASGVGVINKITYSAES